MNRRDQEKVDDFQRIFSRGHSDRAPASKIRQMLRVANGVFVPIGHPKHKRLERPSAVNIP